LNESAFPRGVSAKPPFELGFEHWRIPSILEQMKRRLLFLLAVLSFGFVFATSPIFDFDPLPSAVTGNAVAGVKANSRYYVASMMGVGPKATWGNVTTTTYVLNSSTEQWSKSRDVPGTVGRIDAAAVGAQQQILLFGGAVLDANGRERIVPDVDGYEPTTHHWYSGTDMPVAVADAVIGVYRDQFIYVFGGLSNRGPVKNVQVYDIKKNTWQQATQLPGPGVFGHAGALVDDVVVYVDGAERGNGQLPYEVSHDCWKGKINRKYPLQIAWTRLPDHPGNARFGIEAGGYDKDRKVYFLGGSPDPHLYNGMGFDGKPAEPSPMTFDFNLRSNKWELISKDTPHARMDGGLLVTPDGLMLVGGLEKGQTLASSVPLVPKKAAVENSSK
jgi:Galactose oxidase, central domain